MEKERFNSAETMDETPSSETDSVGDQAERKSLTSADPALCPFLGSVAAGCGGDGALRRGERPT